MRRDRQEVAHIYLDKLKDVEEIDLPCVDEGRMHSWHLFPLRFRLENLSIDRDAMFQALRDAGVLCSVHWRPLHLHPYYQETYGWLPESCPTATALWTRLISVPIFSGMRADEIDHVLEAVKNTCATYSRHRSLTLNGYVEAV
jgi:perosamine synthetase